MNMCMNIMVNILVVFWDLYITLLGFISCVCRDLHHWIYIYIYIYCHPQTDCFVLSELFNVARHAGRSKPGSKTVQLYVRLSLRPLGHQCSIFSLKHALLIIQAFCFCLFYSWRILVFTCVVEWTESKR